MTADPAREFEARCLRWEHERDARNGVRSDNWGLENAMMELAVCCRDLIVHKPPGGADLGTILIGHKFEAVLKKHGLAIIPDIPTPKMRDAWKRGWFRSFYDRYRAMLAVPWTVEASNQPIVPTSG